MLVDSHCHLEQLQDPGSKLLSAANLGVTRVVSMGEDQASSLRSLALKEQFPDQVLAGIGFHPMFTPERSTTEVETFLGFLESNIARADQLGEVGLDYRWAKTEQERAFQREVLGRQLKLSAAAKKPINLHSRWALRQTMDVAIDYTRETGLGAQLHWFTQSKKLIRLCNQAGVYVSVGPSILNSEDAQAVAKMIKRDLLLLETDSPVQFEGREAEPAWVARVADQMATLWECDVSELAEQSSRNFERFMSQGR